MDIAEYLEQISRRYFDVIGDSAVTIFAGGSYCQNDFCQNSDLDIYAFCNSRINRQHLNQLAEKICNTSLRIPAKGLEFHLVELTNELRREPEFLMVLSDGGTWPLEIEFDYKVGENLIGLKIVQESGKLLGGADISKKIPMIPPHWLKEEVQKIMTWHKGNIHDEFHDPFGFQAVLNSCRALSYSKTDRLVSKTEGAKWFLKHYTEHRELVASAIKSRLDSPSVLPKSDVLDFISYVEAQF